jgi:hypothetical protein
MWQNSNILEQHRQIKIMLHSEINHEHRKLGESLQSVSSESLFVSNPIQEKLKIELHKAAILSPVITGFWEFSIVLYSNEHKSTQRFRHWICFLPQVRGGKHLLC